MHDIVDVLVCQQCTGAAGYIMHNVASVALLECEVVILLEEPSIAVFLCFSCRCSCFTSICRRGCV